MLSTVNLHSYGAIHRSKRILSQFTFISPEIMNSNVNSLIANLIQGFRLVLSSWSRLTLHNQLVNPPSAIEAHLNHPLTIKSMKTITLLFALLVLQSCGVTLKSVVDDSSIRVAYKNPLIVIPYQRETKIFATRLKENFETLFAMDQKKVEVYLFEISKRELKLNETDVIATKINNSIQGDSKDLIIVFNPTNLLFQNGGLVSATYQIVANDTNSSKEIWKAEFNSKSSFGPAD